MKRWFVVASTIVVFAGFISISESARAGATIEVAKDKSFSLGLLLQPQILVDEKGTASENWSFDPLVRRIRILAYGQYTQWINFFVDTDAPNWGKQGNWQGPMFVQDAYVELNLHTALQINLGMLLLPFSHHGMQGATSLLMTDYHSELLRYPDGATKNWRDVGVMLRGELLERFLEYRLAVTNGVQDKFTPTAAEPTPHRNRLDRPWVTGRLTLNLFDAEGGAGSGGMFYDGIYLEARDDSLVSPKKIVSFGVSASYQPKAGADTGSQVRDFLGLAADVFVDWPVGDGTRAFNGQIDGYFYDVGDGSHNSGWGGFAEIGFRYGIFEPLFGVNWFDVADTDEGDILAFQCGFAFWLYGHNANIKVEFGGRQVTLDNDNDTEESYGLSGTFQMQLLF